MSELATVVASQSNAPIAAPSYANPSVSRPVSPYSFHHTRTQGSMYDSRPGTHSAHAERDVAFTTSSGGVDNALLIPPHTSSTVGGGAAGGSMNGDAVNVPPLV